MADKKPLAPFPAEPKPGTWWRHAKTGNKYVVQELSYSADDGAHEVRYRNEAGIPFTRRHSEWFARVEVEEDVLGPGPECKPTGAKVVMPRQRFYPLGPDEIPKAGALSASVEFTASFEIAATLSPDDAIRRQKAAALGVAEMLAKALTDREPTMRGRLSVGRPRLSPRQQAGIETLRQDIHGLIRERQRRLRRELLHYRAFLAVDEGVLPATVASEAGRPEAADLLTQVFQHAEYQRLRRTAAERGVRIRPQDPFTIFSRCMERGITLDRGQGMWAGRRAAEAWRLTHGGADPPRIPEETDDGVFNVFAYPRTNELLALVDHAIDSELAGASRRGLGARRRAAR